jgi:hypothetical protein
MLSALLCVTGIPAPKAPISEFVGGVDESFSPRAVED